MKGCFISLR